MPDLAYAPSIALGESKRRPQALKYPTRHRGHSFAGIPPWCSFIKCVESESLLLILEKEKSFLVGRNDAAADRFSVAVDAERRGRKFADVPVEKGEVHIPVDAVIQDIAVNSAPARNEGKCTR